MPSRVVLLLLLAVAPLIAQTQTSQAPAGADYQQMISEHFGSGFTLDKKFAPISADLDTDGLQDLILVSFGKNPMGQMNDKHYKVVDPYDAYFGFGDPRVTTKFSDFGDGTSHCVLVMHDYQAQQPKAKFVIVNLPFEKLGLGSMPYKKKTRTGIAAQEEGGLNAIVFWDGKKYRWEPTDFSTDMSQLDLDAK